MKIIPQISKKITDGIPPIEESVKVYEFILVSTPKKDPTYLTANKVVIPCNAVNIKTAKKCLVLIIETATVNPAIAKRP